MGDPFEQKSDPFVDYNSDNYIFCVICFVDTKNNVFDAVSIDQKQFVRKCQYLEVTSDISGSIMHPSAGDTCIVRRGRDGSFSLEKTYVNSNVNENGIPTTNLGQHSKFMPGDKVWLAKGGSFLQLLRSGLTKIGVTPICQMVFMKMESYTRWISRNIEILTSGFRLYSVNKNGENITRLSLFLTDAMSKDKRDQTSDASDFEIQVADSSINIFTGPKDSDGNRANATQITLVNTGDLLIWNFKHNDDGTQTVLRRVQYTADGSSEDAIYGKNNDVIYSKNITRMKGAIEDQEVPYVTGMAPFVTVTERVAGDYSLVVDGTISISAGEDLCNNGTNVYSVATVSHSIECVGYFNSAAVES